MASMWMNWLHHRSTYNFSFLKELIMKMPKLTFIKFRPFVKHDSKRSEDSFVNTDEREREVM